MPNSVAQQFPWSSTTDPIMRTARLTKLLSDRSSKAKQMLHSAHHDLLASLSNPELLHDRLTCLIWSMGVCHSRGRGMSKGTR